MSHIPQPCSCGVPLTTQVHSAPCGPGVPVLPPHFSEHKTRDLRLRERGGLAFGDSPYMGGGGSWFGDSRVPPVCWPPVSPVCHWGGSRAAPRHPAPNPWGGGRKSEGGAQGPPAHTALNEPGSLKGPHNYKVEGCGTPPPSPPLPPSCATGGDGTPPHPPLPPWLEMGPPPMHVQQMEMGPPFPPMVGHGTPPLMHVPQVEMGPPPPPNSRATDGDRTPTSSCICNRWRCMCSVPPPPMVGHGTPPNACATDRDESPPQHGWIWDPLGPPHECARGRDGTPPPPMHMQQMEMCVVPPPIVGHGTPPCMRQR